jgi:N-acetylglucosaminyldiphosphoundecaprenol N-acetyl-beta-D-mannosaminyltransferase
MSAEILSVRLSGLDLDGIMQKIEEFLGESCVHQITPVNPEFIMATRTDPELLEISNRSELTVADGVGLRLAAAALRLNIGERVTGVDLTWKLAEFAARRGHSLFLLGAGEGVAKRVGDRLHEAYPALNIAGVYAGSPKEGGIVDRINASGADILLVAFGVPKQEKFISENRDKLRVRIAMCVGGTFDFIAGVVPRAPKWMRSIGLEWLFRLLKQPQRINRIMTATVRFPLAVVSDTVFNRSRGGNREDRPDMVP